jgi:hypothetical protein
MKKLNELPAGNIQFLDNSVPAITSGQYLIDVQHSIADPSYNIDTTFAASQSFLVNGPRFALPPGKVQSRFPLPNAENDFHQNLAFMVFNDQNLPWSRTLNGASALPNPPSWLALMIFKPGEISYTPPPLPDQPNPTSSVIRPIAAVLNPETGVVGPAITLNDYEKSLASLSAVTIDVLGATFQSLAPQLNELPYIGHLRQINTGGQTTDGVTGNGYYSILMANRLPDPSATNKYTAHLVSLEGWENYLPGAADPKAFPEGSLARLVSLDSWTFTSMPQGADFLHLVENLKVGTLQLALTLPQQWEAPAQVQAEVTARYKNGFVALNYTTRLGQNSFGWYRGPFNPVVPALIENTLPGFTGEGRTPLTTSDEALIYDQVNGVFDLSYAVAFETGRMLTLGNKSAALAVWSWKRDAMQLLQILSNLLAGYDTQAAPTPFSTRREQKPGLNAKNIDWAAIRADLLHRNRGHQKFVEYVSGSLGKHFLTGYKNERVSPIKICDPSKLSSHNDPANGAKHLPGLLSKAELEELSATGEDPYVLIVRKLKNTLETPAQ